MTLNRSLWCSEAQSNVFVPSSSTLSNSGGLRLGLGVEEDMWLLLESALRLNCEFGGHDCGAWSKIASRGLSRFESERLWNFQIAKRGRRGVGHVMCGKSDEARATVLGALVSEAEQDAPSVFVYSVRDKCTATGGTFKIQGSRLGPPTS